MPAGESQQSARPGPEELPPRLRRRVIRPVWTMPFVVIALLVGPINMLHVARIATISPLDELMHIDYLVRASHPGFLRMSDRFTQEAMNEIACRGHPSQPLPACGKRPYVPEQFSWKGRNLASSHSPNYYIITGVLARPFRALLPGDSIVTWGRALGTAWLLAGFALTLAAACRLGVPPWPMVPVLVMLALSPSTQHAATTINPDATAVFAGGLTLWVVVRAFHDAHALWRSSVAVFAAGLFAVLLDPGNLLAVVAMAGFAVVSFGFGRRLRLAVAAALGTAVVVGQLLTTILVRVLGVVDYSGNPQDVLFSVKGITGPMLWGESTLLAMVPPTKGYLFPILSGPGHIVAATVAIMLAVAGLVGAATGLVDVPAVRRLARVALTTLVVGGPCLVATRFLLAGTYFPIPARYGLSLVPIIAIASSEVFRRSWYGRALPWLSVVAMTSTFVYAFR